MIRAIITLRIQPEDARRLTYQMNHKALGALTKEPRSNYVISGNRDVHLGASFAQDPRRGRDRRFVTQNMALVQDAFRVLQSAGVSSLPEAVRDYPSEASFFFVADADILLVWQDRSKGVYLQRHGQLFRLQPVTRPDHVLPYTFMPSCDFYSLTPRAGDLLLFLAPDFVAQFQAEQLEELLATRHQLTAVMDELTQLARTYDYLLEQSWLGIEIQRVEANSISQASRNARVYGPNVDAAQAKRAFADSLKRSKVSRVAEGQALIIPSEPLPFYPTSRPDTERKGRGPQLGERPAPQMEAIPYFDAQKREDQRAVRARFEPHPKPRQDAWERLRDYALDEQLAAFGRKLWTYFTEGDELKRLRRLLSLALGILLFLMLILGIRALNTARREARQERPVETSAPSLVYDAEAQVQAPAVTDLEIVHVLRAQSLQLHQGPDLQSPLIVSIPRGAKLVQLAPEHAGWVFVRYDDEKLRGYVYASYLLEQP